MATDPMTDNTPPTTDKPRKLPRWAKRTLISLAVLVLVWTGIWFGYAYFLDQQANNLFLAQEGEEAQQQLRAQDRWITGYPFGWYLHFEKPEVASAQTAARFSADHAKVGFHLSNFREVTWETTGQVQAAFPVPTNNPTLPVVQMTLAAEKAHGHFTLSDLGPRDPELLFETVKLRVGGPTSAIPSSPDDTGAISLDDANEEPSSGPNAYGDDLPELTVESIRVALLSPVWPPTKAGDPALTIQAELNNITSSLPDDATVAPLGSFDLGSTAIGAIPVGSMGGVVDEFHFTFTLTGPLPRGVFAQALGQWRDEGGAVDLDALKITLGDVEIEGTGGVVLDTALQPAVSLELDVQGHRILLDRLVEEGTIQRLAADFTATMLRPLVTTDDDGNESLGVTLGLRDRWLMLGPFQIMRIPYVRWAGSTP